MKNETVSTSVVPHWSYLLEYVAEWLFLKIVANPALDYTNIVL